VEDSLKVIERAKADSTRRAGARADTLKTLGARVDSLTKANAAVPDSLKTRLDFFKADSSRTDSVKKAADKAKADSTKLAAARTDSLKKLNARVDSLKKAGAKVPDSLTARLAYLREDSTAQAKAKEKPGYKPDEIRIMVRSPRDAPKGALLLRGGQLVRELPGAELTEARASGRLTAVVADVLRTH